MSKHNNFKETEIGRIPKEWEVMKLRKIFDVYGGATPPTSNKEYWDGEIFWVTPTDVTKLNAKVYLKETEKKITDKAVGESSLKVFQAGTLLLTSRTTIGFTVINANPVTINQGMTALLPKDKTKVDSLFCAYYFQLLKPYLEQLGAGSTFKEVSRSTIKNLKLPLPPLAEQQKIAEIISTADEAIEKVDQTIEKTQRLKKGLMQKLFTEGVVDSIQYTGERKFKDTEIGRIPKGWEVVRLGDIIKLSQYGLSIKMGEQGKYPVIKMDDIVNGYVVKDNVKYVDLDEGTQRNFKLEKGDVLFNRTNSHELVGRTGIFLLDGDYVFASYLIRLKPVHEIIDSYFLTSYLTLSNDRVRQLATRAVHQANINATNLQKFKLPLPPLPEQQKIAEILGTADKRLELLRMRREKLERIKKGLMNDLLTGKRRVLLDSIPLEA